MELILAKEFTFGMKALEKAYERTGGRGNGGLLGICFFT
jgi:hypothetical protein